jgi:hypothetical protein
MDFIRDQRLSTVVALFNCNELGQSDFVSDGIRSRHRWTRHQTGGARSQILSRRAPWQR